MEVIEASFYMDLVLWNVAVPPSGAGRRRLEVVGPREPSDVAKAADSAGLANALRHLSDGARTAINPGYVVSSAGHPAELETSDVAASSRRGAS